jgi:hypothetical protein
VQKFRFSLSNNEGRQDGIIDGPSFLAAVDALSERIMVRTGDKLEIGVTGFPPATFECVGEVESFPVWVPANRLAA